MKLARLFFIAAFLAVAAPTHAAEFKVPTEKEISNAFDRKCKPGGQIILLCGQEAMGHWIWLRVAALCGPLLKANTAFGKIVSEDTQRCDETFAAAEEAMKFFDLPIRPD